MAALAQCDAFAYIYDQAGDPAPDILVVLKRVIDASGNPILLGPKTTLTDSAGSFHFTLPELSTAFISARASALWNCPDGRAFTVPPGPSGELVPDFSLPASTLVEPPLVYVSDVLSIPRASATQDGYLSAADFAAFEAGGAEVGVTQINTGTGLTGGPITDTGTIGLATISGVAGTWSNPSSITVNAQGQIIAITSGAPDTTAPTITLGSPTSITGSSVTINWTTNEPADSQVDYSIDTSYGTSTTLDTAPVLSHSVPISDLAGSQLYHYRVNSKDTAGNPATPVTGTFTTTSVLDTTAPIITLGAPTGLSDTGVTIHWTTNEASDSQVDYSIDTSFGTHTGITNPVPPGVTTHAVPLSVLTAATLYHYRVNSKDAAGNPATPVASTFTTTVAPSADLLTGLVSMWKLDEPGAGDVRADSHGSNDVAAAFAVPSGPAKSGFVLAAHFPGDSSHLEAASNTSLQTGDVDYTAAFWVQLDNKAADYDFFGKNGGSGSGTFFDEYIIGYQSTPDRFHFTVGGGTTFTYTSLLSSSFGPPSAGTWYLIVCWHDTSDGTINIQVNNGVIDSVVRLEPMNIETGHLNVGIYGQSSTVLLHGLAGSVDEIGFWKGRVLDAAARTALWNGGSGLPFSSWT